MNDDPLKLKGLFLASLATLDAELATISARINRLRSVQEATGATDTLIHLMEECLVLRETAAKVIFYTTGKNVNDLLPVENPVPARRLPKRKPKPVDDDEDESEADLAALTAGSQYRLGSSPFPAQYDDTVLELLQGMRNYDAECENDGHEFEGGPFPGGVLQHELFCQNCGVPQILGALPATIAQLPPQPLAYLTASLGSFQALLELRAQFLFLKTRFVMAPDAKLLEVALVRLQGLYFNQLRAYSYADRGITTPEYWDAPGDPGFHFDKEAAALFPIRKEVPAE